MRQPLLPRASGGAHSIYAKHIYMRPVPCLEASCSNLTKDDSETIAERFPWGRSVQAHLRFHSAMLPDNSCNT